MWLRKEALAVEETPNYLPAVRVKLNNPGVGKAGLWERHKSISQGMLRHTGQTAMKGSRAVLADSAGQTGSAHPSAPIRLPGPGGINQTRGGRGKWPGGAGWGERERKGSARERKSQIKGRNSSEITELFIFPAASGDFFFFPL